jgi:hypothetical protein
MPKTHKLLFNNPTLQMLKRKAENGDDDKHQPRKRIRPLLQRDLSVDATSNCVTSGLPERNDAVTSHPARSAADVFRRLPALKVEKSAVYNFNFGHFRATINVMNYVASVVAGCSLHKVKFNFSFLSSI